MTWLHSYCVPYLEVGSEEDVDQSKVSPRIALSSSLDQAIFGRKTYVSMTDTHVRHTSLATYLTTVPLWEDPWAFRRPRSVFSKSG